MPNAGSNPALTTKIKNKPTKSPTFKINKMEIYQITYSGSSRKFQTLKYDVVANSEREAVVKFYSNILDYNYFPQDDGSILDCDGYEVASADDNFIYYDGGYFSAEIVED